jgi:NTP pyrophosphatase (non-canonical NTP hydrolase)
MADLEALTHLIQSFIKDRDWNQFHNPKDLAISLDLEAAEVLEHFQWKNDTEITKYIKTNKKDISEELADVLYWVLLMSSNLNIDIDEAFREKMKRNELKYPISKSRGNHSKYTEL